MDNFVRRIRSLSFVSAVAGALSIYVVLSFMSLQEDFGRVQRLFFATLLISDDYVARVDPLRVQPKFASVATEEDWERVKSSSPPASAFVGETNDFFDANITLHNGVSLQMRAMETVIASGEDAELYDLLAPDGVDHDIEISKDWSDLTGRGVSCPPFEARTDTSFEEEWKLTCFEVTRTGANPESETFWLIDGRPIDLRFDVVKEEKLFYIDQRHSVSGTHVYYNTLSLDELKSDLISLSEKHFVGPGDEESHYGNIRNLFHNQEFSIPIVNVKTSFNEYFGYFVYLNAILAMFFLHTSNGIYHRSTYEYPDEPWIMLTSRAKTAFGLVVGLFLRVCGFCATVVAVTIPSAAIFFYFYEFGVSTLNLEGVVTWVSLLLQFLSIGYLTLSVVQLDRSDSNQS